MDTWPRTRRWIVSTACAGSLILGVAAWKAPTHAADAPHFEYTGDAGPAFWGELSHDWAACSGRGGRQTPIDITPSRSLPTLPILTPLQLNLRPSPIDLVNNGHTVQWAVQPGSTLTFNGVIYDLLQVHFHTLAEHTVDGTRHPMEQHAVFRDVRTGQLAVVGLFYRIGATSRFLAQFPDVPERSGRRVQSPRLVNLQESLTATDSYFAYSGSLTTPPCSEIVTWLVLKTPAEVSQAQFDRAWRVMGNNFRPTQPRGPSMVVFATP